MKYFLLVILALTGCATATATGPTVTGLPEPPTLDQVTMGFNTSGKVSYTCQQSEVNTALVWDSCEFHNFGSTKDSLCITVSYQHGTDVIATSRVVCSGPLDPNEDKENYAAFTAKNGRDRLEQSCGSNMVMCKLTAREVVR